MPGFIVVVDDEVHIRRILTLQLRRHGYEVESAVDGCDALELVRERKPDLIITDYQMPRLDGLSLCNSLRQEEATRDIPIVMLTARGLELSLEELRRQGNVVGLLDKPFSPDDLIDTADRALRAKRAP